MEMSGALLCRETVFVYIVTDASEKQVLELFLRYFGEIRTT